MNKALFFAQICNFVVNDMLPMTTVESSSFQELLDLIPGYGKNSMTRRKITKRIEDRCVIVL